MTEAPRSCSFLVAILLRFTLPSASRSHLLFDHDAERFLRRMGIDALGTRWIRILPILTVVLLAAPIVGYAQSKVVADPAPPDRSYQLLREDEDWSFLKDPALR